MDLDRLHTRCITSEDYFNQQTLDKTLVQASISGDLEMVETCIIAEASIKARNHALFEAVQHGHIDVILSLSANDARLEKSTFDDFISAIKTGDIDRVNNFVLAAPDIIHTTNREGYTPLMIAAQYGQVELIKLFIDEGAELNATVRSYYGNTYLTAMDLAAQYAIHHHDSSKALAFFIQAQATMSSIKLPIGNYGSNKDVSLFIWASYYGLTDIVKLLLSQDATIIDQVDPHSNQTPLVWAASQNHTSVAITLIESGANPNATNGNGKNLIKIATQNKNIKLIQHLLKQKYFKPNVGLLNKAIKSGCVETVRAVLDEFPDAHNHAHLTTESPLILAIHHGAQRIVSLLLDRKFNVNQESSFGQIYPGYTPLRMAVDHNDLEITDILLRAGANIEWHYQKFRNNFFNFALDREGKIIEKKRALTFRLFSSMSEKTINELGTYPRYAVLTKAFKEEMAKIRTSMLAALGLPEPKPFVERFIDNLWALFTLCKQAFGLAAVEPKMPALPKDMIFKILSEPLLYPTWYHHRIVKDLQFIRSSFKEHETVAPIAHADTKSKYKPVESVLEPIPEAVIFTKFKTKTEDDFEVLSSQEIKPEIAARDEQNTVNQKKIDLIN